MVKLKAFLPYFFLLFLSFLLFWQFFLKNLHPIPTNFMLAWYEPWKSEYFVDGTILLPHKAVAEDIFRQVYPFRILANDSWKDGQIPLWNPYSGAGQPLLATINIGYLDPLNLLYTFFSNENAWSLTVILQSFFIALATFLYCRKIELSTLASLFSSSIFLLSGIVVVRLPYTVYGLAIALLPFSLFLVESLRRNSKSKKIFVLPFVFFLITVSTQPQIAIYLFVFILLYSLVRLARNEFLLVLILFVLGLGLSSLQLLPTLELFGSASLSTDSSRFIFEEFLLPINHYITFLIPNYFGNPSTYNFWGSSDYIQTASYMGLIPFFFVFYLLLAKKIASQRLVLFFLVTAIMTIFLTLKSPFTQFLYSLPIPLFSTGIPSRIFLITTLSVAIIGGFGLNEYLKNRGRNNLRKFFPFLTLVGIIIGLTLLLHLTGSPCPPGPIQDCRQIALRNTVLETGAFLMAVIFMTIAIFLKKQKLKSFFYVNALYYFFNSRYLQRL